MADNGLSITLTKAQIDQVIRETSGGGGLSSLLVGLADPQALHTAARALMDDERLSRSLLRALLVLVSFPPDGADRALSDVAHDLHMSPSTTHRYISTFVEVGLLERDPASRRYKRPVA
jgi:DNA-binding MarR family transcriptional regulator